MLLLHGRSSQLTLCIRFAFFVICLSALAQPLRSLPLAHANAETLSPALTEIPLSFENSAPVINIVFDANAKLQPKEVLALASTRPTQNKAIYNFGFENGAYWINTILKNSDSQSKELVFQLGYALLDSVVFHTYDVSTLEVTSSITTGDFRRFKERPIQHPHFVFPLTLKAQSALGILIKVDTSSSNQFPLRVWDRHTFNQHAKDFSLFVGLIVGAVLMMAVYNMFLSISLGNQAYFFFSITLLTYALVEGSLTGYNYEYLWPNSPRWNHMSLCVISNLSLASFAAFALTFIDAKRDFPRLHKCLVITVIINLLFCAASFFVPYNVMILITACSVVATPLLAYIIGIYLSSHSKLSAQYFSFAFSLFVLSAFIFVLGKFGVVERSFFTEHVLHFGTLGTIIMLSFALAGRINSEKKEKEIARIESINSLRQYQNIYENALEGLFQTNADGTLISCNASFRQLVGLVHMHKSEFSLKNLFDSDDEDSDAILAKIFKGETVKATEVLCHTLTGELFWASLNAQHLVGKRGEIIIDCSLVDITEKKEAQEVLAYNASHDALTDLHNRLSFETLLERAIQESRELHIQHVLLYLDLDQFKIVNDTCGHSAGDELLKQVARLFKSTVSHEDILARIGGDEFALLLKGCSVDHAKNVAERLLSALEGYQFAYKGKFFAVGASIGAISISRFQGNHQDAISLADAACYAAKEGGRNRIVLHNEGDIVSDRMNEMEIVSGLREYLDKNQFVLFRQDILGLQQAVKGERYELLLKMNLDGRLVEPGYFIPALERFHKMVAIDYWVIRHYFTWLAKNPQHIENLAMASINISAQTLGDRNFSDFLFKQFDTFRIPPEKICFEIVESTAIMNLSATQEFISRMKAFGVHFALDDFGTGFSSYSYLKSLAVDFVKIDGSFVRDILKDNVDRAMVESITQISHAMKLKVVAEFVEDEATLQCIKEMGIDYAQGFHIHMPTEI